MYMANFLKHCVVELLRVQRQLEKSSHQIELITSALSFQLTVELG